MCTDKKSYQGYVYTEKVMLASKNIISCKEEKREANFSFILERIY